LLRVFQENLQFTDYLLPAIAVLFPPFCETKWRRGDLSHKWNFLIPPGCCSRS